MPDASPVFNNITSQVASSGNVAAASAIATLPAVAGKITYITGFTLTAAGATAAANVVATVTGLTNTMSFVYVAPAGANIVCEPLNVVFPVPIPASAANTAIVVTLPSLGAGNLNAVANAYGFTV